MPNKLNTEELIKRQWETIILNDKTGNGWPPINRSGLILYDDFYNPNKQGATFTSKDSNHRSNTATGTTWSTQGRTFVGADSDVITLPHNADYNFATGDFTVILWIKGDAPAAQSYIFRKGWSSAYYMYADTNGTWHFKCENAGSSEATIPDGYFDNVFHQIVCVRSSGNLYTYADAVLKGGPTANTKDIDNTRVFRIGSSESQFETPITFFTGTIGEFWVYNKALSSTEITANYNVTKWRYQ